MKVIEIDCYEVVESDGGGVSEKHIAYVNNMALAEAMVLGNNYRRYYEYKNTVTIFDTMEEVEANSVTNLRKSGLAKLTRAERLALGL